MSKCYGCGEEYEYSALNEELMCEECVEHGALLQEESKWDRKVHDDIDCDEVVNA
jgi:uncharacterized Zn ribbon protein